jgi:hypothetical protein
MATASVAGSPFRTQPFKRAVDWKAGKFVINKIGDARREDAETPRIKTNRQKWTTLRSVRNVGMS